MLDAATIYCIQRNVSGSPGSLEFEQAYREGVTDADSQAYWDAAAIVLRDLFERDGAISPGQLFYVSTIYPEHVDAEEVEREFRAANAGSEESGHWSYAAARLHTCLQFGFGPDLAALSARPGL
jgi:hypothetical protein